jgi:hypothetical protein
MSFAVCGLREFLIAMVLRLEVGEGDWNSPGWQSEREPRREARGREA